MTSDVMLFREIVWPQDSTIVGCFFSSWAGAPKWVFVHSPGIRPPEAIRVYSKYECFQFAEEERLFSDVEWPADDIIIGAYYDENLGRFKFISRGGRRPPEGQRIYTKRMQDALKTKQEPQMSNLVYVPFNRKTRYRGDSPIPCNVAYTTKDPIQLRKQMSGLRFNVCGTMQEITETTSIDGVWAIDGELYDRLEQNHKSMYDEDALDGTIEAYYRGVIDAVSEIIFF